MTGIVAALVLVVSALTSDQPILASGHQLILVENDIKDLKRAFEVNQAAQSAINAKVAENLDRAALEFQQSELERQQKEHAPLREIQNQVDKINEIRLRLKLPPINRP
jgi:hypothetical protein